jgi:hypothetical protein
MIDPKPEDIGRAVIYRSSGGDKIEEGVISSVNERYVFVRYGSSTSAATFRENLYWPTEFDGR